MKVIFRDQQYSWLLTNKAFVCLGPRLIINLRYTYGVEGVQGFGEHEHRLFQWPHISLVPQELCQYGFNLSGKGFILPLKQTNK